MVENHVLCDVLAVLQLVHLVVGVCVQHRPAQELREGLQTEQRRQHPAGSGPVSWRVGCHSGAVSASNGVSGAEGGSRNGPSQLPLVPILLGLHTWSGAKADREGLHMAVSHAIMQASPLRAAPGTGVYLHEDFILLIKGLPVFPVVECRDPHNLLLFVNDGHGEDILDGPP